MCAFEALAWGDTTTVLATELGFRDPQLGELTRFVFDYSVGTTRAHARLGRWILCRAQYSGLRSFGQGRPTARKSTTTDVRFSSEVAVASWRIGLPKPGVTATSSSAMKSCSHRFVRSGKGRFLAEGTASRLVRAVPEPKPVPSENYSLRCRDVLLAWSPSRTLSRIECARMRGDSLASRRARLRAA